ncbi:MAG: fibronectin type III domain-containing protein [Parafilimonas sp.]
MNGYVFAATTVNGIFRSANNGSIWQEVNNGLHTSEIYSLLVRGNDLLAGTMRGVYISSNNGASWRAKNNGLPKNFNTDSWAHTVAAKGDTLFTSLYDISHSASMRVFKSENNGDNWTKYTDFPDLFAVRWLQVSGNNVYAGTETESVWKNTVSASTCSPLITNTSTSNITSTSAILSWNVSNSSDSYQIQYGKDTFNVTTINTNNTAYTLTNLQPNRRYGWRVRGKCGNTYSAWSQINIFRTRSSSLHRS